MSTSNNPNSHLAVLIQEAGMTSKGLARRMVELSNADGGEPISPSHTSVDRWLSGAISQPKQRTQLILASVLSSALGRSISVDELGYSDASTTGDSGKSEETGSTPGATTENTAENHEKESEPPVVEQWIGDTDGPIQNRVSGNVGSVVQIGGNHYGGIRM